MGLVCVSCGEPWERGHICGELLVDFDRLLPHPETLRRMRDSKPAIASPIEWDRLASRQPWRPE